MARLASPSCSEGKTPRRGSFDAGRSSTRLLEDKRPGQKFALDVGRGQFDIKVDAANRPRHLEFRLSITFARARYSRRLFSSATTVSMVTPGTPFSKSFRLHALPSRRHRSLANFCRISSDIGLAHLVVQRVRHTIYSIKSP